MLIVEREISIVQRKDISLMYLECFYMKDENKDKLILIYDGDMYWTTLSYNRLRSIHSEYELMTFLDIECCHEYLCEESDNEWAELIYNYTGNEYIPIMQYGKIQKFVHTSVAIENSVYVKLIHDLLDYLRKKKIQVFCIYLPSNKELASRTHEFKYFAGDSLMWRDNNRKLVESILKYITDKNYDEAKKAALSSSSLAGKVFGKSKKRIFLVGGCTVNGWAGFQADDLPTILYEKLKGEYEIHCVLMGHWESLIKNQILEYDIRQNDLIIMLEHAHGWCNSEIDIVKLFDEYKGDKWLYYDQPSHTTRYGNELIANKIAEKIAALYTSDADEKDNKILHKGRPMISYRDEKLILQYCNDLPKHSDCANIGGIVMNCNPFTLGHRYLVEQALKQVDRLYLFVVEEDASEFSFADRFEMVKAATKDLEHVIVIPSGKFVLSRWSFKNYFEKEKLQGTKVDASKDLYIFAEYIARMLGISKRFVGEEPIDTVTKQYNQQMKEILMEAGIQVLEIPRKVVGDRIISASYVRKCMKEQNWGEINKFVPEVILRYLKTHTGNWEKKIIRQFDRYEKKILQNMVDFIRKNEKVILYATGQDAVKLLKCFPKEITEKLCFCDKRAYIENYEFMGKKVMNPQELLIEKNSKILVSSMEHRREIYDMLMKLGIENERIMFNQLYLTDI